MMIAIILFLLAAIAIFLECFLPGGILGGIGVLLVLASSYQVYLASNLQLAAIAFISESLALIAFLFLGLKWLRLSHSNLILSDNEATHQSLAMDKNLVGQTGLALTDLHPSGTILLDRQKIDVISRGEYIKQNTRVTIIHVEGHKVVVKGADS